jgi:hypothetical protein
LFIENQYGAKIDVRGFFPGEKVSVQGTYLDIAIPYEGDDFLWKVRASTHTLGGYPEIIVQSDSIVFKVAFSDSSADSVKLKSEIDGYTKALDEELNNLNKDVESHNKTAPDAVKEALWHKRQQAESTIVTIEKLGIPVKRREEPLTYVVPTIRRASPANPPEVALEKYKPEPILEEKEYQYILKVMRSMSLVIERNPRAFATLDEEAIRTHFLLQLNGHYEGGATGETFNAAGKTDILIRVEDRNIFIAECKFWHGPTEFNKAIDQLLSYLSWRDIKCALVVFNKTKNSSSIIQKMHEVMEKRDEYRRTVSHDPNGDSKYIFVKKTDPGREIIITTQLYDMTILEK